MTTKEHSSPFDPLRTAPDDEPFFPLMARDSCTPPSITYWCSLRRIRAMKQWGPDGQTPDSEKFEAELRQCADAERIAMEMDEWRRGRGDALPALRATYAGGAPSEEELAAVSAAERREVSYRHLREGAYHVNEARMILLDLQLISEGRNDMLEGVRDTLNEIAAEFDRSPIAARERLAAQPSLQLPEPADDAQ